METKGTVTITPNSLTLEGVDICEITIVAEGLPPGIGYMVNWRTLPQGLLMLSQPHEQVCRFRTAPIYEDTEYTIKGACYTIDGIVAEAECKITVKPKLRQIYITPNSLTLEAGTEGQIKVDIIDPEPVGGYNYHWIPEPLPQGLTAINGANEQEHRFRADLIEQDAEYTLTGRVMNLNGLLGSATCKITVVGTDNKQCKDPEASKYDPWSSTMNYLKDSMVSHNNLVWQARWEANIGVEPGTNLDPANTWKLFSKLPLLWRPDKVYLEDAVVNYKEFQYKAKWETPIGAEPDSDVWEERGAASCNTI